jgi:uridine kinase
VSAPVIIGIAGCSGSGKTTLAEELARELEGTHLRLDHYYRDLAHLGWEERSCRNFDHPDQLESSLLIEDVTRLANGEAIYPPQYDFATHTRVQGRPIPFEADHLLIVEGIFALHYEGLRSLYDLGIYVDAPDEVCFRRRLARDVRERGRDTESVAAHYAATVRPMADKYVRPSGAHAGLVVEGTGLLDSAVESVLRAMKKRGLLTLLES